MDTIGLSRSPRSARTVTAMLIAIASVVIMCAAANAQSNSKWRSFDPKASALPLSVTGSSGFPPGLYMIYVANSDPDGRVISRWNSFGPLTLQANDRWEATLMPSAQLRLEKSVGTPVGSQGEASIYARNGDIAAWQSICVLPVGVEARPHCFGGTMNVMDGGEPETFSQWASVAPGRQQFGGQPGSMLPLIVKNNPHFLAGSYMIYVANSDPHGMTISRWNTFGPVTLKGQDKWVAVLMRNAQLRLEKNEAALLPYATPDSKHAMIYTRNDEFSSWHAICVLPVHMKVEQSCFGGSNNVVHVAQKPVAQTSVPPQHSPQAPAPPPTVPQSGASGAAPGASRAAVYVGQFTVRRGNATERANAKREGVGKIELIVKDGSVSGSMNLSGPTTRWTALVSGKVGPDLRISAQIDGKSEWLAKPSKDSVDAIMRFLQTYPFRGDLTGRVDGSGLSGSYLVRSTDQRRNQVEIAGTWKAAPKQ